MSMIASVVNNQSVFNASKGFLVHIVGNFLLFLSSFHFFGFLCLPMPSSAD
jgi:hypothetical protein